MAKDHWGGGAVLGGWTISKFPVHESGPCTSRSFPQGRPGGQVSTWGRGAAVLTTRPRVWQPT